MIPSRVERLQECFWADGRIQQKLPTLLEMKERINSSIASLRDDHLRSLNPTPYKVSVTQALYAFLHKIWLQNAPIGQLE